LDEIMATNPKPASRPGKSEFSIDEFIGEIEKAEAETLNKRLMPSSWPRWGGLRHF